MKIETLKEIIKKKSSNEQFAVLINLTAWSYFDLVSPPDEPAEKTFPVNKIKITKDKIVFFILNKFFHVV